MRPLPQTTTAETSRYTFEQRNEPFLWLALPIALVDLVIVIVFRTLLALVRCGLGLLSLFFLLALLLNKRILGQTQIHSANAIANFGPIDCRRAVSARQ